LKQKKTASYVHYVKVKEKHSLYGYGPKPLVYSESSELKSST